MVMIDDHQPLFGPLTSNVDSRTILVSHVVWFNTVGMYGFLTFWLGTKEQAEFCQDTRRFDKGRGFNNV